MCMRKQSWSRARHAGAHWTPADVYFGPVSRRKGWWRLLGSARPPRTVRRWRAQSQHLLRTSLLTSSLPLISRGRARGLAKAVPYVQFWFERPGCGLPVRVVQKWRIVGGVCVERFVFMFVTNRLLPMLCLHIVKWDNGWRCFCWSSGTPPHLSAEPNSTSLVSCINSVLTACWSCALGSELLQREQ